MSGPYCKTCEHFKEWPLSGGTGECTDPCKIIYDRSGNNINCFPDVQEKYSCCNHTTMEG